MSIRGLSRKIADNRRLSYFTGFLCGMIPYIILLYLNSWNPFTLITEDFSVELAAVTGVVMKFISGLGISLTYTAFCAFVFTILSPFLKGHKTTAKLAYTLILIPTLIIIIYASYRIGGATILFEEITDFDLLLTISGVWSLVLLVYIIPLMKDEYNPELEQGRLTKIQETAGDWKYFILREYRTVISRDYGGVYENEFQKYRARMTRIRIVLSGLLLLPISFALFSIPPIAALSLILWARMFSLDYTHFSDFERGLLILTTLSIAILTTLTFFQPELIGFISFFGVAYGFGLLSGIVLLFLIML